MLYLILGLLAVTLLLLLKFWPKSGKLGINLNEVVCPECNEPAPKVRKPKNKRQLLWGGWSCEKCGTEMDKYGTKVNS